MTNNNLISDCSITKFCSEKHTTEQCAEEAKQLPIVLLQAMYLSGRPVLIFSDKNGVVVVFVLKNRTVCNAVLYEIVVNSIPEQVLGHSVAVLVLGVAGAEFSARPLRAEGGGFQSVIPPTTVSTASTKP